MRREEIQRLTELVVSSVHEEQPVIVNSNDYNVAWS